MEFADSPPRAAPDTLTIDVDGWEGPLDLLLALARSQKIDLREISILALVEQYLAPIANARTLRLEVAADYLVMAAWLALLKSALLLPRDDSHEPGPDELALRLQLRLRRLDAMRDAGERLLARDRIGRDVFVRGAPEGLRTTRTAVWSADLYELISAYGAVVARSVPAVHQVQRRPIVSLEMALRRLSDVLGTRADWTRIEAMLVEAEDPALRRSALASSFVAALELARQGRALLRQSAPFAPLFVRAG